MQKVSIITVSCNSESTIRDTVESVLAQDFPDIEYIIVDGGSTDRTMEIVREYEARIDSVISEPDKGIYDGMNKGILAAGGDVVGFLNSDDFYSDQTSVRRLVERMNKAGADTVFADLVYVDPVKTDRVVRYYNSGSFYPGRLRFGWMPAHPTLLVKRHLYETYGGFKIDYKIAADYEMVVRLFYKARVSYVYLDSPVIRMRSGGASTRGLKSSWILNNEIVRACRENGLETNLPLVFLKIPAKIMECIRKPLPGMAVI